MQSDDVTEVDVIEVDGIGTLKRGERIKHPMYGRGVVENVYNCAQGDHTVRVQFEHHGMKMFEPGFAKVKKSYW